MRKKKMRLDECDRKPKWKFRRKLPEMEEDRLDRKTLFNGKEIIKSREFPFVWLSTFSICIGRKGLKVENVGKGRKSWKIMGVC